MSTAIPWADETWNTVTGCTKTSPGCANCYIERSSPFRMAHRKFVDGTTGVQIHPERLDKPLHWRKPRRIFVCSLADLFHEDVPDEFIDRVFATMALTHWHTFQVLTKRPERMAAYLSQTSGPRNVLSRVLNAATLMEKPHGYVHPESLGWPYRNIWLGVTIENARYTYRADILREIPAAVRFISAEPLLGSLVNPRPGPPIAGMHFVGPRVPLDLEGIDWVIVGAESGPKARPMDEEWARELRDACLALMLPCTCYPGMCPMECEPACPRCNSGHVRPAFFYKQQIVNGRKVECPELDGRQWMEFPA